MENVMPKIGDTVVFSRFRGPDVTIGKEYFVSKTEKTYFCFNDDSSEESTALDGKCGDKWIIKPVIDTDMNLRDKFACAAMQSWLVNGNSTTKLEVIAEDAYAMADAMLAERNKVNG